MKDIKRYGCDVYYDRGMYECSGGEFVSHDDYAASVAERDMRIAALQEQVRELAAENAAMKRDLRVIANSEPFEGDTAVCDFDSLVSVAAGALVTPATEAALREIRAQAVDAFGIYHNFSDKQSIQAEAKKYAARIHAGEQP